MPNELLEKLQQTVTGLTADIGKHIDKSNKEVEEFGKISTDTKAALTDLSALYSEAKEKQDKEIKSINERFNGLEAKFQGLPQNGPAILSPGQQFIGSEAFKSAQGNKFASHFSVNLKGLSPSEEKTAATLAAASHGDAVIQQRVPGFTFEPDVKMRVRNVFPTSPTSVNEVEWIEESTPMADAAIQEDDAAPPVAKAENAHALNLVSKKTETIATHLPATRQLLDDVPQLESFINDRLRNALLNKEDSELLTGAGTVDGLIPNIAATTAITGFTILDAIDKMIEEVNTANHMAGWIMMHPTIFHKIRRSKGSDANYLLGNPATGAGFQPWGLRVFSSPAVPITDTIVGDFSTSNITLFDRQSVNVRTTDSHGTDFIENMIRFLIEERLLLAIYLASGFRKADLTAFS